MSPATSELDRLLALVGVERARQDAADSVYADGLVPLIEGVVQAPERLWRAHDVLERAGVVSAFNLDRVLGRAVGYGFAELVDRARVARALETLAGTESRVDEVAETYWPPRTREQQLKELHANVVVADNKLSSRENLDAAFQRVLGRGLDDVVAALRS